MKNYFRFILSFALFFAFGCNREKAYEKRLRICFSCYPNTVDPRKSGDFTSSTLICMLYEGLMRCLPGEEIVENGIAEKVDILDSRTVYIFHLRDAFWSDGHPVTAQDFKNSWMKTLDPSFPALCSYLFFPIKNAENFFLGKADESEVGIEVLDTKTLKITLENPCPYFLSLIAFPSFLPVPSHKEDPFSKWDLNPKENLVVNGPFYIEKIQPNLQISLKKNFTFWNTKSIFLNCLEIHIVPDELTAFQMFERGEVDWIGSPLSPLPLDALQTLKKNPHLHFNPMAASTFIALNTKKPPFSNLSIRKAFSLSIDRTRIVEDILGLGQIPATSPLPPSLSSFSQGEAAEVNNAFQKQEFSPELKTSKSHSADEKLARKYLEKGMQELQISKKDFDHLIFYYRPGQTEKRIAQALQRTWKENLGVSVQLKLLDKKSHTEKLHTKEFQLALACWIAQFHDPLNLLERYKEPKNPKNYSGWSHPEFSALIQKIQSESSPEKRKSLLFEAETILAKEIPLISLYHWASPNLVHPKIKNLGITKSGGVLFEKCQIEDSNNQTY